MRREIVIKSRNILGDLSGKRIGILGLSFKPNTDDMRDSPAIDIINLLINDGAEIVAYDPIAIENAKKIPLSINYAKDEYDCAKDADLLILVTDWNEFKKIDFKKIKTLMKKPNIIDSRNIYDPENLKKLGFNYVGVGR